MKELPHETLFETFIFGGDEERMKAAEHRSAHGAFMWGEEREEEKVKGAGASEAQGGDKRLPKATCTEPGHTRMAFRLLIPLGGAAEKPSVDLVVEAQGSDHYTPTKDANVSVVLRRRRVELCQCVAHSHKPVKAARSSVTERVEDGKAPQPQRWSR